VLSRCSGWCLTVEATWVTFRVESTLRLKRSEYINKGVDTAKVCEYLQQLRPGQRRFLRGYTITQTNEFVMNVALFWDKGYEEPWVLMTTHANLPATVQTYGKRFGIEPMHKDWKSNAFDIEGTRVTNAKRIETLLIPIALCYILCVLEGNRKEAASETIREQQAFSWLACPPSRVSFDRLLWTVSNISLTDFSRGGYGLKNSRKFSKIKNVSY